MLELVLLASQEEKERLFSSLAAETMKFEVSKLAREAWRQRRTSKNCRQSVTTQEDTLSNYTVLTKVKLVKFQK